MANRRPPWKIPAVINPEGRRCIQINIPDDPEHISIFWGVLRGLSDWQRWEREPTKSGTLVAQVWRDVVYAIDWEDGCMGCCEDRIVLHRVTEDGAMEVSYDDGESWVPDPNDPRTTGTNLPNTIPGEEDGKKCNAATNAVQNFKDAQASFSHSLTTATTVIGLAAAFAAEILLLLLSAGTAAEVLIPLMIATATGLFGVLEGDYNAEFTEEVWDDLTCDIFCTVGDDGQFTDSQLINLQARVDSHFSDNVALTFQSILRGWGTLGLNNACISGIAATADCSECVCEDCSNLDNWEIVYGTLLEQSPGYMRLASAFVSGSNFSVRLANYNGGSGNCCGVTYNIISGVVQNQAYYPCGSPDPIFSVPPADTCMYDINLTNIFTADFEVEFFFSECP